MLSGLSGKHGEGVYFLGGGKGWGGKGVQGRQLESSI